MSRFDSLGDRMKGYESVSSRKMITRMPTIIRIDGKSFHTYTKHFKDSFDVDMHNCIVETTKYLVSNIQNAVLGYTQSDEISILLVDYNELNTEQWFGAKQSKIESVSASMAAAVFNEYARFSTVYNKARYALAVFDSRCFNLPREEVCNYFIWRQQDATRNSVQMLGRDHFSHRQLQNKNQNQILDMLINEKGINWNRIETWKKRGTCVTSEGVDDEPPIFTAEREYIERFIYPHNTLANQPNTDL